MILLYRENDLLVTGYQSFPKTTTAPHIECNLPTATIKKIIGKVKLTKQNENIELPINLNDLINTEDQLQKEARARLERDNKLGQHIDIINAVRWNSFSTEQQTILIEYRQSLLDIPEQVNFPDTIDWPIPPDFT